MILDILATLIDAGRWWLEGRHAHADARCTRAGKLSTEDAVARVVDHSPWPSCTAPLPESCRCAST